MGSNKKKPWREKQKLKEGYINQDKTIYELADEWGCSPTTVGRWKNKYNIEREEPKWKKEGVLHELYVVEGKTTKEIAEELGCSQSSVSRQLINTGIRDEDYGPPDILKSKEFLIEEYTNKGKTAYQIAEEVGSHPQTVYYKLKKYDIPRREHDERIVKPYQYKKLGNKSFLRQKYIEEEKSAYEISELVGCSNGNVYQWLDKHNIPTRSLSESHPCGSKHPDWTGGISYGEKWHKRREERIEYDNSKCFDCGITRENHTQKYNKDLSVHHRIKREDVADEDGNIPPKIHSLHNLVTLCCKCHPIWEGFSLHKPTIL